MTIEIKITDPSKTSPAELQGLIRFLQVFAVGDLNAGVPALPLAHADLPSTGVEVLTASQAFGAANNPTAAFGPAGGVGDAPALPGAFMTGMPPGGLGAMTLPALTVEQQVAAGLMPPSAAATVATGLRPTGSPSELPPTPAVDTDSAGVRWDVRIHTSNKAKKADGTFKAKPKVDAATVAAVLAEQKQAPAPVGNLVGAPMPGAHGQPGVSPGSGVEGAWPFPNTAAALGLSASQPGFPPSIAPGAPLPNPASLPGSAGTQGIAVATTAYPSNGPQTYIDLVGRAAGLLQAGHITQPELVWCCNQGNVADIATLAGAPTALPAVLTAFAQLLAHKGVA